MLEALEYRRKYQIEHENEKETACTWEGYNEMILHYLGFKQDENKKINRAKYRKQKEENQNWEEKEKQAYRGGKRYSAKDMERIRSLKEQSTKAA